MDTSESITASTTVTILNRLGLHARPAMSLVDLSNQFQCAVKVSKDSQTVDGKSIMQVMMLAATQGTKLEIEAAGPDAEQAIAQLEKLFSTPFGEDG